MKIILIITLLFLTTLGCKKEGENHPCYNESIQHDGACPTDCPGFEGCDGKTYCNQCEAARVGIGPR